MSEAKHTARPWSPRFDETYSIREADGGQLAILTNLRGAHGLAGRRASDEVAANARLIAAAPDLLDALKLVLENCGFKRGESPTFDVAFAAIAKAEGSQHG